MTDWMRVVIVAMIAVALLLLVSIWPQPTIKSAPPDLQGLPVSLGEWRLDPNVVPLPPAPDVAAQLDQIYDQVVARTYVNNAGERVMLSIAYGGDQRDALQAHLQEVCYRAQGFKVSNLEDVDVSLSGENIRATRMLATRGSRSEFVTYWLTMGDRVVRHRGDRLAVQVRYGVTRQEIPDGMMIRVSSLGLEAASAYQRHVRFLDAMLASMLPRDRASLMAKPL